MRVVEATLVSRMANGIEVVQEEIPIGMTYLVDLDSIQKVAWLNRENGEATMTECIASVTPMLFFDGWYPTELLTWEGKAVRDGSGLKETERQSAMLKRMMARKEAGHHRGHPQEAILCALDEAMYIETALMAAEAENARLRGLLEKIDGGGHVV